MIETATLFTGVNVGYQGNAAAILDPLEAAVVVTATMETLVREAALADGYEVHPGVVVYHRARGCADGGEAVGFVRLFGPISGVLALAEALREKLDQTTLSLCTPIDAYGLPTRGFTLSLKGDVHDIGTVWQNAAAEHAQTHGGEISCGLYAPAKRCVVIQADANPHKISDLAVWESSARTIIEMVGQRVQQKLQPHFRSVGFTYLRKTAQACP